MTNNPLTLAIETSTRRGSVALGVQNGPLGFRELTGKRPHTAEMFPAIQELLRDAGRLAADIGVFCYSSGPGSFTGLRVAATVGRMLQSAVGCEVVAVSTLEVIARNLLSQPDKPERIAAILDARREQVYGALFERSSEGDLTRIDGPAILDPQSWLAGLSPPFWIVGDGIRIHADACRVSGGRVADEACWPPSAREVLTIGVRLHQSGNVCRPEEIVPLYLRPPACEEVYEKRRAEARRRRGE
ncbi:MAG: tRNA (adenosine(37)-N6)-threonylcarbamoyltransferase complex dimerization subunit type 1 TsaB [Planctomycetes bacterium]|nr:tRNA (adenosine(37)-N6)-threonylcarbamoyltransferase complex dimerization subunit type 1 TsaB [Planctomycetota bacterium]